MLNKFFKLATALGLLMAAHLAYVRAFDRIVVVMRASRTFAEHALQVRDSDNKAMVQRAAAEAFGQEHWTNSDDLLRYVVPDKGMILIAANFARPTERDGVKFDGKRIEVDPAAVVLRSPKGGETWSMESKRAVIDFNQPFGINLKPDAEPLTVTHARLEREVVIRNDRATPDDPADDLVIGPLTEVEYVDDGVSPVIKTGSEVVLVDRDLRVTGDELEIQLRPKTAGNAKGGGFEGAQRVTLFKRVRTTFLDSGGSGMLADAAGTRPDVAKDGGPAKAKAKGEPIPLDVQCQGPLVIDLPRTPVNPAVGPPEPPKPTYVEFRNTVVVRRGKLTELPDQIDCDTLHLTLLPGEKKLEAEGELAQADGQATEGGEEGEARKGGGSFGGLTLRRIKASGHAVWVQSPTQGVKIRCVELLHYKDPMLGKNTTIFNGGGVKKLWVEKRELASVGPEAGKARSITHIWCSDATLVDQGDAAHGELVANGPGLLESRPILGENDPPRDVPPSRTAVWRDQLWVKEEVVDGMAEPCKVLVLKGIPRVEDRDQKSSLEAADYIAVWLNPEEKKDRLADGREVVPAAYVEPVPGAAPKESLPNIRKLLAIKNVHLIDPNRDLTLRDRLAVNFETGAVEASPLVPAPAGRPQAPASQPAPDQPAPAANGEDVPAPAPAQGAAAEKPAQPEKPAPPKMTALADWAVAKVIVAPKAAGVQAPDRAPAQAPDQAKADEPTYQLSDVEMRGGVQLHQDPGPGKKVGTDAVGEVLVLSNEAKGQLVFDLYHHDPHSDKGRGIDPKKAPKARVRTEEMTIVADVVGIDQRVDHAWARGEGWLKQLTDRAVFTDRPSDELDKDKAAADAAKARKRGGKTQGEKTELTVTWKKMMTFEGVSQDLYKRPAAKIKFYGGAHAVMEDALLHGEESLTVYTDKPIPLVEAGKLTGQPDPEDAAGAEGGRAEKPRADLSMLEVRGNDKYPATAISRKVDPNRPVLLSQQRLESGVLLYDRREGTFRAPGPGKAWLYDRNADPAKSREPGFDASVAARPVVTPTAYRPGEDDVAGNRERIAATPDAARRAGVGAGAAQAKLPTLVLTQIKFAGEMQGRFGSGKADDVDQQRWAEFFGDVETARGPVAEPAGVKLPEFDYDRLPPDATFLTSDKLRVINEPPPPGSEKTANGRNFLKAWDNAYVRSKDTAIQADVMTYDSLNDLVLANGLEGRPVQIVQQGGVGQPGPATRAAVVRFNPKSQALDVVAPEVWRFVDARTGTRPSTIAVPDGPPKPATKPKKPPTRIQTNPAERKGFTGR